MRKETGYWLSPNEACELLKRNGLERDPSTIRRWIRDGYLPAFYIGGRVYTRKDAVLELLQEDGR